MVSEGDKVLSFESVLLSEDEIFDLVFCEPMLSSVWDLSSSSCCCVDDRWKLLASITRG